MGKLVASFMKANKTVSLREKNSFPQKHEIQKVNLIVIYFRAEPARKQKRVVRKDDKFTRKHYISIK